MLDGFKKFLLRGNVIDLAVGVVIGGAFGAVVNALTKDLLTPLVTAIFQAPDFSHLSFTFNNSTFAYGEFLNAAISFLLVAASVYFFVVLPLERLNGLRKKAPPQPTTKICSECLSEVPIAAKRCSHCTQILAS